TGQNDGNHPNAAGETRPPAAHCRILPLPHLRHHVSARRRKTPPRLHRLDARLGLPAHVPDSLFRLLAQSSRPPDPLFHVLTAGRHFSRAAVSVPGRNFLRPGHRKTPPEESSARPDRPQHYPPWRRNLRLWPVIPPAG